ncbi:MAG: helix-turn-helix domain-containing protein, partial [Pseudomonadota bacterium]
MTDLSNSPNPDEDGVDALLRRVGDKVRVARQKRGLPRRVLSDMSGVSPRYLAQLEAGEGNISIGLLQRVARALNHPIEDFVQ